MRIRDLASARVRYDYRRIHVLLRREGWLVNAKRVNRLYRLEGLEVRTKVRKKRASALRTHLPVAQRPNEQWSMDFISDALTTGRRFRVFTLVDNMSRKSRAIEVGSHLTGHHVVAVLKRLVQAGRVPRILQVDNGPEFSSRALDAWAHRRGVKADRARQQITPSSKPSTADCDRSASTSTGSSQSRRLEFA